MQKPRGRKAHGAFRSFEETGRGGPQNTRQAVSKVSLKKSAEVRLKKTLVAGLRSLD